MAIKGNSGVQIRGAALKNLLTRRGLTMEEAAARIGMSKGLLYNVCSLGRTSVDTVAAIRRAYDIRPTSYVRGGGILHVDGRRLCDAILNRGTLVGVSESIGAGPQYLSGVIVRNVIGRVYATLLSAKYGINAEEYQTNYTSGVQLTLEDVEDEPPVEETNPETAPAEDKKDGRDGLALDITIGILTGMRATTERLSDAIGNAIDYDRLSAAMAQVIDYEKLSVGMFYAFELALERVKQGAHARDNQLVQVLKKNREEAQRQEAAGE